MHINFPRECSSWSEAESMCSGYDSQTIVDKVLATTLKVQSGEYAYERDSVGFSSIEYSWPVLCGLLLAANANESKLSVLDFGGSLGSSYFQNRKFLSELSFIKWSVVEQLAFVNAGNDNILSNDLYFYTSIDEYMLEAHPNVILLSSVLQYLNDYHLVLNRIMDIAAEFIIFDRTPFLKAGDKEKIFIQKVPNTIYQASYPCRFFIEKDFLQFFKSRGYTLYESFSSLDDLDDRAVWKGFIFRNMLNKADKVV
jgi:putative methyltransferase (TIGR04325 family)